MIAPRSSARCLPATEASDIRVHQSRATVRVPIEASTDRKNAASLASRGLGHLTRTFLAHDKTVVLPDFNRSIFGSRQQIVCLGGCRRASTALIAFTDRIWSLALRK